MGETHKVSDNPLIRASRTRRLDRLFFGIGTAGAVWLAVALVLSQPDLSWWSLITLIGLWLVLAYLALPRLNRILAAIYVPEYFIGRTRTSDGLLGDPLNLAVNGTGEQLSTAMRRAGWILADPVDMRSSIKIVTSTILRRSYDTAPVSPLLLFNRQQDAAYQQEVDGNPAQRHHVRFWRTPEGWPLPGGTRVDWLAAGTFDRAVGLSLFTLQITHKIDANIDVERDHIISTVTEAEPNASVEVLQDFTTSYHSRNGGGDSVHTDGNMPILDLTAITPDTDTPDLVPHPPIGVPLQVWFPALINLLLAPLVIWSVLDRWPSAGTGQVGAAVEVGSTTVTALLALALVVRRSALARLVLLVVTTVTALTHITAYGVAETDAARITSAIAVTMTILILIALSSPVAATWTGKLGDQPESASR